MYFKNVYRRLNSYKILALLAVLLCAMPAWSQVRIGLDFSSIQENRSATQLSSIGRSFYDGYLNIGLKKDLPLYLALGYLYIDSVENYSDLTFTNMISTNPYLGFAYHFRTTGFVGIIVGGFYSPYAKLALTEGVGSEAWDGTSTVGKLTASVNIVSNRVKLNVNLYYISETFNTRVSGNVTSKSSMTQSYLAPSLGVALAF